MLERVIKHDAVWLFGVYTVSGIVTKIIYFIVENTKWYWDR